MSEDVKTQLVQEVKQIEDKHNANPERAAIWAIKEYLAEIAHVIAKAKEHLSDQDFDCFLHEIKTSPKTAKSLVEDLARDRYFDTVIEPVVQRWTSIFEQINRIGGLIHADDQPHYTKVLVALHKEVYEVARELDKVSVPYNTKNNARMKAKELPSIPTYTEMTNEFFKHITMLAEDEEYARKHEEERLSRLGVLELVDKDEDADEYEDEDE